MYDLIDMITKTIYLILATFLISSIESANLDLPKPNVHSAIYGKELKAEYLMDHLILEMDGSELAISKDKLPTDISNPSELIYFRDEAFKLIYDSPDNFRLYKISSSMKQLREILAQDEANNDEEMMLGILSEIKLYYPDYLPIDMSNYADFKNSIRNYLSRDEIHPDIIEGLESLIVMRRGFNISHEDIYIEERYKTEVPPHLIRDFPLFKEKCFSDIFDFQELICGNKKQAMFALKSRDFGEYYLTISFTDTTPIRGYTRFWNLRDTKNHYTIDLKSKDGIENFFLVKINYVMGGPIQIGTDEIDLKDYQFISIRNKLLLWTWPMLWIHNHLNKTKMDILEAIR